MTRIPPRPPATPNKKASEHKPDSAAKPLAKPTKKAGSAAGISAVNAALPTTNSASASTGASGLSPTAILPDATASQSSSGYTQLAKVGKNLQKKLSNGVIVKKAVGGQTIRQSVQFWQTKAAHDAGALTWAKGRAAKDPNNGSLKTQVAYYQKLVTGDQGSLRNVQAASAEAKKLWGTDDLKLDDKADPVIPQSTGKEQTRAGYSVAPNAGIVAAAGGPKMSDVKQGGLGDCYLLSSLASLAQQSPKTITDNIKATDKPGVYQVKIFKADPKDPKKLTPVIETVDTDNVHVQPQTDPATGKKILWPALYEQAFAQSAQQGSKDDQGFQHIAGGWGKNALPQLTGQPVTSTTSGQGKGDSGVYNLRRELDAGRPVVVSTRGASSSGNAGGPVPGTGIVANHEYSVVSITPDLKSVTVRNPWGVWPAPVTDPRIKVGKDGSATMPTDLFYQAYNNEVTVG